MNDIKKFTFLRMFHQLLSYFSASYSNLALLSIFSYLFVFLCGSFSCIFYFYFLVLFLCQNVFVYDHCYRMVNVF